ncbi:MAG TPA: metal-dependent hydrolase [Methanocorpusculum sp.]|nr:metal-dependent hydrolase [Methanocorpusculum sp.]
MLIFFHLFVGLIAGVILAVLFSNKMAVLYGGIGGILPDMLDKPLAMIFFENVQNNGRVIFHNLTVVIILLILGFLIWRHNQQRILLLCVSIGIFLHQLGDTMWGFPENWLWPISPQCGEVLSSLPGYRFWSLPFRISDTLLNIPHTWFSVSEAYIIVPDNLLPVIYLLPWIIAIIAGIIISTAAYRHLRPLIRSKSGFERIGMITGIILLGIGMLLLVTYIVWEVLLTGPWAGYFGTLGVHEIFSVSEWVYGIVSLILILLVLNYPIHISGKYKSRIIKICGTGIIIISALILPGLILGLPIDEVYGPTIWKLQACAVLFIGGIILLLFGAKGIIQGED